jgi:tRNA(Ile)-lysidine synthetase-like protein
MPLTDFVKHFRTGFPELVGRRVLVALSGGADSTALLHLLRAKDLALELEAAHVHHGVRGTEADDHASFCESLCAELSVPFHFLRIDPRPPLSSGREGTWRHLRYRVLEQLRKRGDFKAIATGHHRDDVAEGVIVQLLRGGGPRALSGIEASSATGIVRPLLQWSREEIRSWLEERGIEWREDSSNLDFSHLRNRVRHDLLPGLEPFSPAIRYHLAHLARTLATDEAHFARELVDRARWIDPWDPDGGVPEAAIHALSPSLRVRWLHAQASRIGLHRVTRRQADLFAHMIDEGHPRAVTLGERWTLRIARQQLWLEPPTCPDGFDHLLELGSTVDLPIPGWRVGLGGSTGARSEIRWSKPSHPDSDLRVRNVDPDDRIEVDGEFVRATKIIARRLPRHLRTVWPVFCEDDRIYWIPGAWQGPIFEGRGGHIVEVMRREKHADCV